jgi:(p)ppGpp synthase/HD superfamily hydrolase
MNINVWPYIELSRVLINKKRRGTGNMFRHQLETFSILLEYGYTDPVLLKAALIHDLFEDGQKVGFSDFKSIMTVDEDGKEVYDLVQELSIRAENDIEEPKDQFLERIMNKGSQRARVLKLADRLSNINSLPASKDIPFIKKYIEETILHILPYAQGIDKNLADELKRSLLMFEV